MYRNKEKYQCIKVLNLLHHLLHHFGIKICKIIIDYKIFEKNTHLCEMGYKGDNWHLDGFIWGIFIKLNKQLKVLKQKSIKIYKIIVINIIMYIIGANF